jgi:hypothetical protein
VAKLTTVDAQRNTTVLNEASGGETFEVLLSVLRPALSQLRATRLLGELNREDELPFWIADQVDNCHVDRNLLLLGDQEDWKSIFSESGLHIGEAEVIDGRASVCPEAGAETIEILLLCSVNQLCPSLFSLELWDTSPVDHAALLALKCLVALIVAELALNRVGRAVASRMALDTAGVTGAGKFALDTGISAVSFVVANLSAVEALAGEAAASGLVWASMSEVPSLVAAVIMISMVKPLRGELSNGLLGDSLLRKDALTCGRCHHHHLRQLRRRHHCRHRPKCHRHQKEQLPMNRRLRSVS